MRLPLAREDLRIAYLRTNIEVLHPEHGPIDAASAAELLGPYWVLTAANPWSVWLSDVENEGRNLDLETVLRGQEFAPLPAVGRSPDGRWAEASFAVPGLGTQLARRIGREHEQHAVFEVDESKLSVHGCPSRWVRQRAILEDAWEPPPRSDATLAEVVEAHLGLTIGLRVKRFASRGWRIEGDTDLPCDRCGVSAVLFTGLNRGRNREWYETKAIVCPACSAAWLPSQVTDVLREAVDLWADWHLAASDGAELGLDGQYFCYVVGLDPSGSRLDPDLEWVYVGETGKSPEERLADHKEGRGGSSWVRKYGRDLRLDLMRGLPTFGSRVEAQRYEVYLKAKLELWGYGVKGGH